MPMKKRSSPSECNQAKPAELAKEIKALLKELPEIRADAVRLDELRRIFGRLEVAGELTFTPPAEPGDRKAQNPISAKWNAFLHRSHEAMVSQLCERVRLGRHASIRCMWGVIAGSPISITNKNSIEKNEGGEKSPLSYKCVNADLLSKWIWAMTLQESTEMDKGMRHMIEAELLSPYRDIQYFSLTAITKLATSAYEGEYEYENDKTKNRIDDEEWRKRMKTRIAEKLLELLIMIPVPYSDQELENKSQFLFPPPLNITPADDIDVGSRESDEETVDDDCDSDFDDGSIEEERPKVDKPRPKKRQKKVVTRIFPFQQIRMFRREYKKAWLSVLRLPLPVTSLKKALHLLPETVLNYVAQPLRFADFFMQAYADHGSGIIGVLALDGLFLLITEYGLEYENFYTQLYKLVSARLMYAKYRSRFYSLLNKCLVLNAMLPAHLVAAFIKRLCRCSVSGPPSGALFALALVSNLLKKHPECNCLVQRKEGAEMVDRFLADEDDPVKCHALQSSLWELAVLEKHYHPAIATMAKSIGRAEEDKAPLYNIEEFVKHTYTSLFDREKKKKSKTALTFKKPNALFSDDDIFCGSIE